MRAGPEPPGPDSTRGGRAQTAIDFLIAMGIFLVAVAFVLSMIPNITGPFSDAQERPLVADRVADQLADGMLADTDEPAVLNATCTFAFFDSGYANGDDCPLPFDASESDLADRLDVSDTYSINVTIRRNYTGSSAPDTLFRSGDALAHSGSRLAAGDPVPSDQSVISTQRRVYLDGKDVVLVVKVW